MRVVPRLTAAKKEWLPACLACMWSSRALKLANHCNQSGGEVPVECHEDPGHSFVYLHSVLVDLGDSLVRGELSWLQLEVFLPGLPVTWRIRGSWMNLDILE